MGCGQREPQPPDLCQKGADLLEEVVVATITYWEAIWPSSIEVHDKGFACTIVRCHDVKYTVR